MKIEYTDQSSSELNMILTNQKDLELNIIKEKIININNYRITISILGSSHRMTIESTRNNSDESFIELFSCGDIKAEKAFKVPKRYELLQEVSYKKAKDMYKKAKENMEDSKLNFFVIKELEFDFNSLEPQKSLDSSTASTKILLGIFWNYEKTHKLISLITHHEYPNEDLTVITSSLTQLG